MATALLTLKRGISSIAQHSRILANVARCRITPTERVFDFVVIGNLLDNDLIVARFLSQRGYDVVVVRRPGAGMEPRHVSLGDDCRDRIEIVPYTGALSFLELCRRGRGIISVSGTIFRFLGSYWRFRKWLRLPSYVNITTGSDITELAVQDSEDGCRYREMLRNAAFNVIPLYPTALVNVRNLGISNFSYHRYPYYLPPRVTPKKRREGDSSIIFFHYSRLDWGDSDSGKHRKSSKGNDRFIRAFIRSIASGLDARCIILDRGEDRINAKALIDDLGGTAFFEWCPPMPRNILFQAIADADVIVDQFEIGGFGSGSMEAMAQAKPLMIYIDRTAFEINYGEQPPILNCRTEIEIYEVLMRCSDREYLRELGEAAYQWVHKFHGPNANYNDFLYRLEVATGCRPQAHHEWS